MNTGRMLNKKEICVMSQFIRNVLVARAQYSSRMQTSFLRIKPGYRHQFDFVHVNVVNVLITVFTYDSECYYSVFYY